jgi:hypothetical protein
VSAVPGEPVPWPAADLRALPDIDRLAEQALHREPCPGRVPCPDLKEAFLAG